MSATPRWAIAMAAGATGTALCLSTIAGWQRGGSLSERVVWVAMGVVLIVSAHLLPTLVRSSPFTIRITGSVLWGACMVTACIGHVTFFLFTQQHAGEARASAVTRNVAASPALASRTLTAVMQEGAAVTRQLALARAQRCSRDCPFLDARRVTLAARLDALEAEADDIRRQDSERDRTRSQRDALLADPVTSRLAALLGTTTARVDLLSGVTFAAVLEGVACLLWTVALRPLPLPHATAAVTGTVAPGVTPDINVTEAAPPAVTSSVTTAPVRRGNASARRKTGSRSRDGPDGSQATRTEYRAPPLLETDGADDALTRLARDIDAGRVRPTVAGIRSHLGCSQSRAASLRRQLAVLSPTA